jgi:hypothetical protein
MVTIDGGIGNKTKLLIYDSIACFVALMLSKIIIYKKNERAIKC